MTAIENLNTSILSLQNKVIEVQAVVATLKASNNDTAIQAASDAINVEVVKLSSAIQ